MQSLTLRRSILSQYKSLSILLLLLVAASLSSSSLVKAEEEPLSPLNRAEGEIQYDVVVYGGTSGGIVAAIKVKQEGKSVVLIEPSRHLGGLTTGGLGATDIGNKAAIGGISREFYRRIRAYYNEYANAWKYERQPDFKGRGHEQGEDTAWTFEPHVATKVYREMLAEAKIPVAMHSRLNLDAKIETKGGRIAEIEILDEGQKFKVEGRIFIDATYEGDLMAKAGVSYHVGREANSKYGETLNGVQTKNAIHHQFVKGVDPYVKPGDKSSGVLPGVQVDGPGEEGSGDHKVQAYCFRLCTTDAPANRGIWKKPADYDPLRYELLLRNFEAGDHRVPWNPVLMPNRKTDSNNNFAISTDNIGMNYDYPNGDYATREKIFAEHLSYQQGLMWTLANSPRVPPEVQEQFQTWGPAKDEFADTGNWSPQLYIREARRMVSEYVMTQDNCQGKKTVEDSVGLAAYTMDSHNIQRYVNDQGHAINEGDVQVGGFPPYAISYRSIRPRAEECTNLLVPVCLSASHIAYGSIRMEPVFMVLGQSAATAACQAIDENTTVQKIGIAKLREKLLADKQVLEWAAPKRTRSTKSE